MFESHASLSVDFEVSTVELDALVSYAKELVGHGGVFGARVRLHAQRPSCLPVLLFSDDDDVLQIV